MRRGAWLWRRTRRCRNTWGRRRRIRPGSRGERASSTSVQELGRAALEFWRQLPAGHGSAPFQWLALWPLIAVALHEEQLALAVDYARALLDPGQQRLPDALAASLEQVLQAWDGGAPEVARTRCSTSPCRWRKRCATSDPPSRSPSLYPEMKSCRNPPDCGTAARPQAGGLCYRSTRGTAKSRSTPTTPPRNSWPETRQETL